MKNKRFFILGYLECFLYLLKLNIFERDIEFFKNI